MKHPKNIEGKFYCTNQEKENGCISCRLCYTAYPEFFEQDDIGNAYVHNQPNNTEELNKCNEAMSYCPVDSIRNDGEKK